jgi:hypothetical protein
MSALKSVARHNLEIQMGMSGGHLPFRGRHRNKTMIIFKPLARPLDSATAGLRKLLSREIATTLTK